MKWRVFCYNVYDKLLLAPLPTRKSPSLGFSSVYQVVEETGLEPATEQLTSCSCEPIASPTVLVELIVTEIPEIKLKRFSMSFPQYHYAASLPHQPSNKTL